MAFHSLSSCVFSPDVKHKYWGNEQQTHDQNWYRTSAKWKEEMVSDKKLVIPLQLCVMFKGALSS